MTPRDDESGFSLVELIIYVVILGVLAVVVGSILANTWRAQASVASVTTATNRGQVISTEVERAMRNAVAFEVSADSAGSTLWVHTDLGGGRACQGFYFDGTMARMSVNAGPLNANPANWPKWQSSVVQDGPSYFTQSGASVQYAFDITTNSAPVRFSGLAAMRTASSGVTAPCW